MVIPVLGVLALGGLVGGLGLSRRNKSNQNEKRENNGSSQDDLSCCGVAMSGVGRGDVVIKPSRDDEDDAA